MSDIAKVIGKRIRKYRKSLGISQEQLAERADMHNNYIGQLERGEKNATLESVEKVSRALNVSLEELFENIVITDRQKSKTSIKIYELVQDMEFNEQEAIYEIIQKIKDYKNM